MTIRSRGAAIAVAADRRGRLGAVRISVEGELDDIACRELDAVLGVLLAAAAPATIVLDLREVSFCGAAGLRLLARRDLDSGVRGGRLVVQCAPQGPVRRLLGIDGLLDDLTVVVSPRGAGLDPVTSS